MHISDFDYDLPAELIARAPAEPRDAARMMVVNPHSGSIVDSRFKSLPEFLHPSDVLVLNDTRVLRARTRARLERRNGTSRDMEVFFAEPLLLQREYPAVYGLFTRFFRQDPAARRGEPGGLA